MNELDPAESAILQPSIGAENHYFDTSWVGNGLRLAGAGLAAVVSTAALQRGPNSESVGLSAPATNSQEAILTSTSTTPLNNEDFYTKNTDLNNVNARSSVKLDPSIFVGGIGCGSTAANCSPGELPIVTSNYSFNLAVQSGQLRRGSKAVYDPEEWTATPSNEKRHWAQYINATVNEAVNNGIELIVKPHFNSVGKTIEAGVVAAKAAKGGTIIVEFQSQQIRLASAFVNDTMKAESEILAADPNAEFGFGIAADPSGHPLTAKFEYSLYKAIIERNQGRKIFVDENGMEWPKPKGTGCAPEGCPETTIGFFQMIGVLSTSSNGTIQYAH